MDNGDTINSTPSTHPNFFSSETSRAIGAANHYTTILLNPPRLCKHHAMDQAEWGK
jgi:hypothetical protein